MGKKNQNISSAKKGMIRDIHPSGLPEGAYTDALNNNIEDESGNGIPNNQNEHSNILCTTFKDGYKVIGHVKDELDDRTYFFLTNPKTGKSEIGYVPEINFIDNEEDIEYQCGCDFKELLNEALENTNQKSTCKYTVVIEDGCNSCLNFSIDFPIRNPILKVEKSNKRIFFTDGFNPPRWIDLNNLGQYKEKGVGTCSETLEKTCIDCNKLLIFPKFEIPCIEPEVISGGGNLRKGTYEVLASYCDALGNELSNYYSVTTPVSIFDLNNLITDQSMLADRVNRSIRFTVDGLDTDNFRYYKVAVIQRTDIDIKYFINGVYTTDNTSFIVDTDEDKTPTDIFKLTAIKPYYTKSNGMTEFNGTLMQFDLETVEELNLQPVVNLMSAFLKWQTHQAKEDIYSQGTSSAKYRGYMRDEVYPFLFHFETDYNYVTTKFPLVGRPPTADELLDVDTNSCDYKSINKNVGNCDDVQRLKKWQYYNTAEDEGFCSTIQKPIDCDPIPYKKGSFSYWESLEKYPDNCELYDSSELKISSEDIPDNIRTQFEDFFVDTVSSEYVLKNSTTNLANTPIRHYKFPSNEVSPFITEDNNLDFKDSIVYPIGVTLDKEVVNAFLDIAVKNNLVTQQQRDGIKSFKLYRGDRRLDKSIKAKGLLYDMRSYNNESGEEVLYPNYPYNDLGDDYLNLDISTGDNLPHPYSGNKNNRFTFHSPDYQFENPAFGTEVSVEAYMYGKSRGVFNEVEGHPKWIILGEQSRVFSLILATAEVTLETVIATSELTSQAASGTYTGAGQPLDGEYTGGIEGVSLGQGSGTITDSSEGTLTGGDWLLSSPLSAGAQTSLGIAITALSVTNLAFGIARKNYEWQKIFKDLGSPKNFSSFYTSVGNYNFIKTNPLENNRLRGISSIIKLKSGKFRVPESNTSDTVEINNSFREWNTYISLGDGKPSTENNSPECDFINYPEDYKNYDNFNTNRPNSSRTSSSLSNVCSVETPEIFKNIASPYISVKDYLPSQYGNISDVTWMPINHCGDLSIDEDCQAIFGGDVYISRMTLKRKLPMFLVDAMDQASLTPFQYTLYNNIGKPRFYINYELEEDSNQSFDNIFFPQIESDVKADCENESGLYYKPPTKFYLYYYGIPSFLVESEINLNYRYAKREEFEQFYPQRTDYERWTQENNVSIREQNTYFHNRVYSYGTIFGTRAGVLSNNYNKEIFDQLRQRPSGVIQSNVDASENNLGEPWLVYKPNNVFEFPTKYGKLIDLKTIESQTILGRFEDQAVIYNRFDNINDKLLPNQKELGTGTVFTRSRPIEFAKSDLGYAGTQNTALVSCQAGHFWVDAKRGQVFHLLPNASNLREISNLGMRNWFKEHLPFKILKSKVRNLSHSDLDNNYKGLGITMAWDDRYRRVFITKLDYKVKKEYTGKIEYRENNFFYKNSKLSLKDKRYFEDVSFTIAYSPITEGWISFYSYKPNYYIEYNNYFQSGMNFATDSSEEGLWSHLLTNRSYQVFYGKLYPWRIEYPVKEQFVNKKLESIQYWLDSKRYHNDYDFAENREIGFDKLWIYNNSEITGELRLNRQKTIRDISKYPKTAPDGSYQDILVTEYDKRWNVNNFYNRTKDENNNVPLWNWDANQIDKTINTKAVSFKGKRIKERLRGDWFLVRLEQTIESRYKTILKWGLSKEDIYNQ